MKRNFYKNVPWPFVDISALEGGSETLKSTPTKLTSTRMRIGLMVVSSGKLRKTLTKAPAARAAEAAWAEAVSSEAGLGRRRRRVLCGGGGGGGGPKGMLRRAYAPCHCPKRSRRGSWGNGPAISQVQWRNAVENTKGGEGGGGREVGIFENNKPTTLPLMFLLRVPAG